MKDSQGSILLSHAKDHPISISYYIFLEEVFSRMEIIEKIEKSNHSLFFWIYEHVPNIKM